MQCGWSIESAYYALRHTLLGGRVLRSGDRPGLEQELWALLIVYQVLRAAMTAATDSIPGTDPDRASFTAALEAAREQVSLAAGVLPVTGPGGRIDLTGEIGRAVLDTLLGPRRPRISVRKVKSPISRYPARPAGDDRPLTSTDVTHLEISIQQPAGPQPQPQTPAPAAPAPEDGHPRGIKPVLALLGTDPGRPWHATEIAQKLGETNINSLATRMSRWAAKGRLQKIGRAVYMLKPLTTATPT